MEQGEPNRVKSCFVVRKRIEFVSKSLFYAFLFCMSTILVHRGTNNTLPLLLLLTLFYVYMFIPFPSLRRYRPSLNQPPPFLEEVPLEAIFSSSLYY